MRKVLFILGVITIVGLSSCKPNKGEKVLVTRSFPTASWERFDYVENVITVTKPLSYDLELDASFDNSYTFDYFSMVFTVFDKAGNPLRSKDYRFILKDREGQWKSELAEGNYHFRFPLNNEISLNEPGTYTFQIENHMPTTPLTGIKTISIISK